MMGQPRHFGQDREREELPTVEEAVPYLRVTWRTRTAREPMGSDPQQQGALGETGGPGGLHHGASGRANAMRRPPLERCPWLIHLLEIEALVPASHAVPVTQE
jgi:hypothetical protein